MNNLYHHSRSRGCKKKMEFEQLFWCKVVGWSPNIHSGWLCRGYDCKWSCKYGEYKSFEYLLFLVSFCSGHQYTQSCLTLTFLVAVVNSIHTKTYSSKEMTEFCFEKADVKSICYCKQRMKSTLSFFRNVLKWSYVWRAHLSPHTHTACVVWCGIGHSELIICLWHDWQRHWDHLWPNILTLGKLVTWPLSVWS